LNIAISGAGATTLSAINSASNITLSSQSGNNYLAIAPSSVTLVSRGGNLFVNALNVLGFENGASSTERARFAPTTGNFLINTTTDAGFKLDVNGTARVQGLLSVNQINLGGTQIFFNQSVAPNNYIFSSSSISILNGVSVRLCGGSVSVNATNNGAAPDASALFDVQSTVKGFLPPRMTTTQKNAIASPATGLMVYDTTLNLISVYNGTTWITL
jgi:hypothetical protein